MVKSYVCDHGVVTSSFAALSPRRLSLFSQPNQHRPRLRRRTIPLYFNSLLTLPPLQVSRRTFAFFQANGILVDDPRNWSRRSGGVVDYGVDHDDGDDEDEDSEDDRSLDLLVRFVENMFKKISRKARKAVRSILPLSISTKLVDFSVNGTIVLAFLWILKAFLEVVCTIGSVVFVSILIIRGIWSWITYLQESRNYRLNELDDNRHTWTAARPAA
ncbi:protein SHORT HYPOCOTYL IN WHITE LIGHT 1 [Malania oleifera]|uniref:protein SHORT HYPOCOTYL IN WHITE LIGHT 1 n=1 Tax=Malania oleifera TaxID=397392 RepID=UPI0025AECC4B|nr:protein SHORT HYPOCOTYL IN WHITE LIGHT 1 [Malania oleifera]